MHPTDAYLEGYAAAEAGRPRECVNPWSVRWQEEWLRGYDEAAEIIAADQRDSGAFI